MSNNPVNIGHKVGKSLLTEMAKNTLHQRTNNDLMAIVKSKEAKKKRTKGF